jgi:hypothetical protein
MRTLDVGFLFQFKRNFGTISLFMSLLINKPIQVDTIVDITKNWWWNLMYSIIREKNINECLEIVREEFYNRQIYMSDDGMNKFVIEILNITYSTGGGFSKEVLREYIKSCIEIKIYEKYL